MIAPSLPRKKERKKQSNKERKKEEKETSREWNCFLMDTLGVIFSFGKMVIFRD